MSALLSVFLVYKIFLFFQVTLISPQATKINSLYLLMGSMLRQMPLTFNKKSHPRGGFLNSDEVRLVTTTIDCFRHIFNNFLRITEDHHCFFIVEQVIV